MTLTLRESLRNYSKSSRFVICLRDGVVMSVDSGLASHGNWSYYANF